MAKQGRGSEQAMIRLPDGMRDRLKDAATGNGRSMNAEIVDRIERSFHAPLVLPEDLVERIRVYATRHNRSVNEEVLRLLEREYPDQWDVDDRMEYLASLLTILHSGTADPRIGQFIKDVQDTIEGVVNGRVKGVSENARREVSSLYSSYQEKLSEDAYEAAQDREMDYDEEEIEMREKVGSHEKLAEPLPKPPNPFRDQMQMYEFLPPRVMQALTKNLREIDIESAIEVLKNLTKEEIEEQVKREEARSAGNLSSSFDDDIPY